MSRPSQTVIDALVADLQPSRPLTEREIVAERARLARIDARRQRREASSRHPVRWTFASIAAVALLATPIAARAAEPASSVVTHHGVLASGTDRAVAVALLQRGSTGRRATTDAARSCRCGLGSTPFHG